MATQIQLRRDTASNWSSNNPTLAEGEIGINNDNQQFKIGDGSTAWNSLSYSSGISDIADDSSPQLGGDLDLNGYAVAYKPSPGSDHEASGFIATMQVDENSYGFGAALYMSSDGNWEMADATSSGTVPCQVMALETGTGSKKVLTNGFVRDDTWDWSPGGTVYLSETTGAVTQIMPTSSGTHVQILGFATHADRIYFNPNYITIENA